MIITRRAALATTAASLTLAALHGRALGAPSDLDQLLDRIATDILKEAPEYATSLAVSEERAGGRYIDRVSDASEQGRRRYERLTQNAIRDLRRLDRNALPPSARVSYDVVLAAAEDQAAGLRFPTGGGATAPYMVTQLTGAYTQIPDFLDSQHPITNREQAEAYLTRLSGYARQLDQESARIAADARRGVIPPDFAIDKAIQQLGEFAARSPGDTVLVQSLARRAANVEQLSAADRAILTERAERIVREDVLPAYGRQIQALRAVRPRAVHDAGCWRLPRGEELYAVALRSYTTTTMAPREIHAMGVDLIASLTSQMDAILRAQGMTAGTVAERVQEVSRRPDQIYPSTDEGRAQLLADLNRQVDEVKALMPNYCGTLARADLDIKRVPAYIEKGSPGGYYQNAALDGSRPGAYYINLRDPSTEWPKFTLPTLTYHEGIPGHHWQISIQQEAQGLPFLRSALLGFSAYAEGWGLYAEQLADEMGLYQNNPLGRLGYLQSMAFRASRLVVDTGMHHLRWTREQAIQSMMAATGDQESNITTEIERYAVWPGQACAYMVGRQTINRLRDRAKAELGNRFDIKGFHDVVLTNGSVPLTVLETLVNDWVAQRKA
jgi:uncharacterized protein (DUF885 family)